MSIEEAEQHQADVQAAFTDKIETEESEQEDPFVETLDVEASDYETIYL